jgi:signal peptidase I
MKRLWKTIARPLLGVLIFVNVLIYTGCVEITKIRGSSMFPAIHDGDYWLTFPVDPDDEIERFDIVGVYREGETSLVKRVVGLPGEEVAFVFGDVFIDGKALMEDYLPLRTVAGWAGLWKLKDTEFLVMGDNRPDSHDSRHFGPVDRSEIKWAFWFRIWRRWW